MRAQHVDLGTNKYDMLKQKQGLKQVTEQEESLLKKLAQEEKEYNQKLDSKIAVWLQNLEISVNEKSVEYKSLKRHLTDLYLLRHDWARDLINRRDRTTDDFKIEAEKKLNLSIFSDVESKIQNEESAIKDERNFLKGKVAENKSDTEILAIGIGHDVSRYYNKAIKITDVNELGDVMISQLSSLFKTERKFH